MSNRTRILMIAVTLAAMNLAGLTALAYAQATDQPASNHDAQRPPTEGEVRKPYRYYHDALAAQAQRAEGEVRKPYRYYHDALAAQAQRAEGDAVDRFWQSEWASQDSPSPTTRPR